MRAVVFGTAGHIDHGKTSLVKALTGVDCDRLPEEKRRGITLVLGFAPLEDPRGEVEFSFIDVPGHERLVHTMISGAAGIDRALLVVAADEGIMPQTREHLDVLDVLGVRGGVVALTKADAVDPERLGPIQEEVEACLAGGPLSGAPVIACSSVTGKGIDDVRAAVLECGRGVVRKEDPHRPFRLAADRAFTVAGAGTVVTGTAHWGRVCVGDELVALPSGAAARVRGIQIHGQPREEAEVGERVALVLAGVTVAQLPRGVQLLHTAAWRTALRLALDVRMVRDAAVLSEGDRVWVHLLAARVGARVERAHPNGIGPGEAGRVIVRLVRPIFAAPGDRVVLRYVSPAATAGGGQVLDASPPRLTRHEAGQLAAMAKPWIDPSVALDRWIRLAGPRGGTAEELSLRMGVREAGLEAAFGRLVTGGAVVVARPRPLTLVHKTWLDEVRSRAREVLSTTGETGVPRAEFLAQLFPTSERHLREFYLDRLRSSGLMRELGGRVLSSDTAPLEDGLAGRVAEHYRKAGFEAPSPEEAARTLGADPRVIEGLVRFLVDQKRLARVGGKWVIHRQVLDEVVSSIQAWGVESFDVTGFKGRFGLTRKLAIPILEWLDSERVTRREGDRRRVVRPRARATPGR